MDLLRYQTECQNTKSTEFFGYRVTKLFLKNAILEAVEALTRLDAIKKSLFYGKASTRYPVNGGFEGEIEKDGSAVETCTELLNVVIIDENGGVRHVQASIDLIHAILGKATEASELLEALYTAAFNGQPLDRVNVIEEIGDGFWYDGIALETLNSNFHDAAARNNAKLKKRFPNKFTTADAITRDTAAERELLKVPAFLREGRELEDTGQPLGVVKVDFLERLGTNATNWANEFIKACKGKPLTAEELRLWFSMSMTASRMAEQKIWMEAEAKKNAGPPEGELAGDMLQRLGTDADAWAREFAKNINRPTTNEDEIDLYRAWFANAIGAGELSESARDQYVMQFIGWLNEVLCDEHKETFACLPQIYEDFKNRYNSIAETPTKAMTDELSERIRKENAG